MKKTLIILITFSLSLSAQSLSLYKSFGNFKDAAAFDIDLNGNIYVSDKKENTIYKLDSLGNEKNNVGGYGWIESEFDEPIDIFTNTLSVYIADKNNNRIQRFDKDLNFLSQYSGTDKSNQIIEFGYPICVIISSLSDLFILDSDNNRILKFNLDGKFIAEFGGNDAGVYSIVNPKNFTTDSFGNIYVLDQNNIKVFDQYGNGLFKFKPFIEPDKININDNELLVFNKNMLGIYDLTANKLILKINYFPNMNKKEHLIDAELHEGKLFILTENKIYVYKIIN